ncbi:MAG: PAS domain S-box protein [Pseudomonadota bacterium]
MDREEQERRISDLEKANRDPHSAKKELEDLEKRYRNLFDNINDIILTHDLEGRFLSVNRATTELLGYNPDELIGKAITDFMLPEYKQTFYDEYLGEMKKKGYFSGVSTYLSKEGEKHYIEYRNKLMEEEGEPPYVMGVGRDISERVRMRKLEKQLMETQKIKAIATLAGGIAHEFNNALTGILGSTDLIRMGVLERGEIDEHILLIRESALRLTNLTNQLMAYAQVGVYQPKIISVPELIEDTLPIIKHTIDPAIRIETRIVGEIPLVEADITQMQLVLSAILNNASEAMEGEGCITIKIRDEKMDDLQIKDPADRESDSWACITIEDQGKGMDEATKRRVFEPFFSTKFLGRGLGMAAVYGIIKHHGGLISIESELGKGTSVRIFLPAMEAPDRERFKPESAPLKKARTILVIADEEMIRSVIRALLGSLNYHVLEAKTGKEAIDIAKAFNGVIDLAILDSALPDMPATEIHSRLLEARPNLKLLICGGYPLYSQEHGIPLKGVHEILEKPFSSETFYRKLKAALGMR